MVEIEASIRAFLKKYPCTFNAQNCPYENETRIEEGFVDAVSTIRLMPLTTITEEQMFVINKKIGKELLPEGLWFNWKNSFRPGQD